MSDVGLRTMMEVGVGILVGGGGRSARGSVVLRAAGSYGSTPERSTEPTHGGPTRTSELDLVSDLDHRLWTDVRCPMSDVGLRTMMEVGVGILVGGGGRSARGSVVLRAAGSYGSTPERSW